MEIQVRQLALVAWAGFAACCVGQVSFEPVGGFDAVLRNAATAQKHQIETMVGGVAAFDYDGDGLVDLFFTNGARQPDLNKAGPEWWNRLYRNRGGWKFEDVTERAGVAGEGFSMGAAVGDYDGDGDPDLFVAGVRRNLLYRNNGDGTFTEVSREAGVKNEPWSVAGGFLDYDGDGALDLFVVNYVAWDPAKEPFCGDAKGAYRTYCHPKFYQGLPNRLYRNVGGGKFQDVSVETGIGGKIGKGMSAAFADYDGDGRVDIAVTNDAVPNFLFRNLGRRFEETGMLAGIAMNDEGRALSSMGVDFRDVDGDRRPDVFITALINETFPFFRNLGKGLFEDATYKSRVGAETRTYSGWGIGVYDFDNDGRRDVFVANGDVNDNTETYSSGRSRQECIVLRQGADGKFIRVAVSAPALHRGAAFADFDNDGRVDAVVSRIGETPLLLRNTSKAGQWLGVDVPIPGAWVGVGGQWAQVTTAVGYASASDHRVHFGLGAAAQADIEVHWPDGKVRRLERVDAGRYVKVAHP